MEIYREQPEDIAFRVAPGTTEATAELFRDDIKIGDTQALTVVEGIVTVNVPYKAIRYDGSLVVVVTALAGEDIFVNRYVLDVVTPILPLEDVAEIIGPTTTPKKTRETERAVRVIVEAFTGQRFGLGYSVERVMGEGDDRLQLPKKLLAYNSIYVAGVPISAITFAITGDGWFLEAISPEWLEIKEAPPEELWPVVVNGPIRVPQWYKAKFNNNQTYTIDGVWGWEAVPADVEDAARLLVNDYSCNQAAYRDRYLDIIKSSDWTLQFDSRAWEGTGNARADLILGQYKRPFVLVV